MVHVLRVDLSTRTTREETLPAELTRDYIGTKGIGSHLLLQEVDPGIDPLGPDAKLIFSAGPLSGSTMPGTDRYAVYFLSPLTGGYGEAYSGGKVATQFARTGYRMVVLEGQGVLSGLHRGLRREGRDPPGATISGDSTATRPRTDSSSASA